MKTEILRPVLSAAILALTSMHAMSALPTLDAFNYAPGVNLPGQTNPDGLTWAAAGPAGPAISVAPGNLAVPGLQPPSGNLIRIANVNGPDARFPIGVTVQDNAVYYSIALQVKDLGSLNTNGSVIAMFNTGTGASANSITNGAAALLLRATGTGGYNVGTVKTSTNKTDFVWAGATFTSNDTVFVVASYTFIPGGANNDEARLWVNPSPFTFGGPTPAGGLLSTAGSDLPQIQSWVALQRPGAALPVATLMDQLRVGNTYAEVTPPGPRDFGDAPASYATLQADNGPRHFINTNVYLGVLIDPETNGIPTATAMGDNTTGLNDEDGVIFPGALTIGWPATLTVIASTTGKLDAWFDFNLDGDFADANEQVAFTLPLVAGANLVTFVVPATATAGATIARFRFSTAGGLSYNGPALDGEVEDYAATLRSPPTISIPVITLTPFLLDEGARRFLTVVVSNAGPGNADNVVVSNRLAIGTTFEGATHTNQGDATGARFNLGALQPGGTATLTVTSIADQVDFSQSESVELVDRVAVAVPGSTQAPLVFSLTNLVLPRRDFGDAPASYGTLLPNGARHRIVAGFRLGALEDAESNGAPSPLADGDDLATADDEDGLMALSMLIPGSAASMQVAVQGTGLLNGWIDWDHNGRFDHPAELIFGNVAVATGTPVLPFSVPTAIPLGPTYLRLRLTTVANVPPTNYVANGEVEDYRVTVTNQQQPVIVVNPGYTPDPVQDGGLVVFSIQVSNQGGAPANTVVLSNRLPVGVTFLGSAPSGTAGGNRTVVLALGDLAAGSATTALVTGRVSSVDFGAEESVTGTNESAVAASGLLAPVVVVLPFPIFTRRDFGDAPDPTYPVLLANNGARHRTNALFLGARVEAEPDGLPSPLASGDDSTGADDEDGVVLPPFFPIGGVANVTVTASLAGVLDVWADFNADGDWFDPGEHVIVGAAIPPGPSLIAIPVPAWTVAGNCFLRFRLSPNGAPNPTGFIAGGEVEDYVVEAHAPAPPAAAGTLRIRPEGGRMRVSWDRPNALLQAATALDGQWTTLTEADDSFDATPDLGQRFFRVIEGRNTSRSGLERRTLASMTRDADLIVDAVVTGVQYRNSDGDGTNSASWPHSFVTLQILHTLKGRVASSNLCLCYLGGLDADGDRILHVSHFTRFDPGERSILFVRGNGSAARPLVGGSEGRLRVVNGLVYSEHGHRLVLTAAQRLAFGARDDLEEVHQDMIGTNVMGRGHSDPQGEDPRPDPPQGTHLDVATFRTILAQAIQQNHTAEELANPVLTVSADCTRVFRVPLPRHRPPPTVQGGLTRPVPDDDETARVKANGGNPVLRSK